MNSKQETWLALVAASAVFLGTISGAAAGLFVTGLSIEHSAGIDSGASLLAREEAATIAVVQSVTPSVVSVLAKEKQNGEWVEVSGGTGVVVSDDGLVLTNRHVVDRQDVRFLVIGGDDVEHEAVFIGADPFLDLAILRFDQPAESAYPPAVLGDSDALQVGQTVMAIGNTLSEFPHSLTRGVISGLNRTIVAGGFLTNDAEVIDHAIQTDTAMSEGNSGGPLINLEGEVIGINTAISMDGQSLGFAIPINTAQALLRDIRDFGRVVRPWLGVHYSMIDRQLREEEGLLQTEGAYVLPNTPGEEPSVIVDSPADRAGILAGDIILSVNGEAVNSSSPLGELINQYDPGEVVSLLIDRAGQQVTINITLEEFDQTAL